jgi:acetyl-CoA carboxylase beta subunit
MDRKQNPLRPYFEKMADIGKALTAAEIKRTEDNIQFIREQENLLSAKATEVKNAGVPAEVIRKRGQMTAYDRLEYLIDPGTWCPLHTLYNPMDNEEGCTGVVDGIGKIQNRWAVVIAFDNKIMAGAWIAGQADNILRVTDLAKRLNIPLVWLLNCSGVRLTEQEKVYANRRGNGATFFRHSELNQLGIPVLNAIFGTNPAGGGYHGISPTILLAHSGANIAVGGAGIVGGMNPKGYFDMEAVQQLIDATKSFRGVPPGRVETHFDKTAYFREVHDTEIGVLDGIKQYMRAIPAYEPAFFRVAEPAEPKFPTEDLDRVVQANQKKPYELLNKLKEHPVIRPLIEGGELLEYSAHLIPEGGYNAMPPLYTDGALLAGDAAMLVNNVHWEGTNLAMMSGKYAAETAIDALEKGDFSANTLSLYQKKLENSFILKDLKSYKDVMGFAEKNSDALMGYYPQKVNEFFKQFIAPHDRAGDRRRVPVEIDLSVYAGKQVKVVFNTEPGPSGNAVGDACVWGEPRIVPGGGATR